MLEQSRDARSPGRSGPEAVRLARRVRALEEVSDRLWRAYESSRVREAVDSGGVEVLRLATASVPVPHRTPLKLLAGGLLGLLLGGGLVTLRAGADGSVSRREELEDDLSLPTLAVIPRIGPPVRRRVPVVGRLVTGGEGSRLWFSRNGTTPVRANGHPEPRRNGAAGRSKNGSRVSIADRMFDSPDSEAYRTLRTNLIFSGAIRSTRSLVVTSPTPGDGKTVTAANLAIALAHQGIKLLLLDADLRAPDLARSFGLPRQPGLTDLLLGEVELATAVRRTETYGLDLLPAGTFVANTSEILSGRRMTRFLEELPERYDLVLIDSPPVLAASDATVLAAVADGVLLVVRAGVTQRTAARHAIERLELVGARVVGSVLNDPDTRLPDSSRYYGSGLHPDADLHEPLER